MGKTQLRKEFNTELASKLLLKNATMWQIFKHVYQRFDTEIWMVFAFSLLAFEVWNKLG